MTDRDDAGAVDLIARHLNGRLAAGIDARLVAGHLVELLREHDWRPIPRPAAITSTATPGDYKAGAAAVREALAEARNRTDEGDPHA